MLEGLDLYSIMLLAVGLAMDALSVATITGFSLEKVSLYQASKMSITFGMFHVVMPVVGWFSGLTIMWLIAEYDHWVAFLLLAFVGGKMILEGLGLKDGGEASGTLDNFNLLLFSLAVSIDTIAAGLSLYLEDVPILLPAAITGAVTCTLTFFGILLGNRTGRFLGKGTQMVGGIILIVIGLRILLTHII